MLIASAPVIAIEKLPEKAIALQGGIISVRAGVVPGPSASSALPIGKLKYPTRYFVELVNEAPFPVWLDAAWSFPKERGKNPAVARPTQSGKVPPQGSYIFYADKLGVIAEQPITVEISAWSDDQRRNRLGGQHAELRFGKADIDVFLQNFPSPYKNRRGDDAAIMISGWQDMPKTFADVPGTATDAVLSADIQRLLWKNDSVERFTCAREVLGVEVLPVGDSAVISRMDEAARNEAVAEQEHGRLSIERWRVRSCDVEVAYEVLLSAAEKGGTDIMVVNPATLAQTLSTEGM